MKKLLSSIFVLMIFGSVVNAQQGQVHLEVSGGAYLNDIYQARFGLEFSKKYHNSIALYGDVFILNETDEMEFLIGPTYKSTILRSKNVFLKWPIGASIGTNNEDFIGALNTGLEFGISTERNIMFTLTQNNQIAFNSSKLWRFGLMAGIKIPFN